MAVKLPRIGVEAIVLGADQYFKDIARVGTSTDATSKSLEGSTKGVNALGNVFSAITGKLEGFGGAIKGVIEQVGGGIPAVDSFLASTSALEVGLAAATAVATAAVTAFVALGTRGAALGGLAASFDRLNQAIGVDSVDSLNRLRVASAGTVSDFDLIRQTNMALAGATGEFGREFGEKLPKLLEIARVQARATGQSVDYLFQSLVLGVKRASPKIIDNTGLVLNITAANEAYALSIGKSVSALTEEDKQIALLNATLASGQTAIDAFAGIQETAAEKMARMNATITNMLDTVALGVQPAFGKFLDVINRVLGFVSMLVTAINPLISAFLDMGAALITGPLNAFLSLIDPIVKLVSWLLTLVSVILVPVMNAIGALGTAFGDGVTKIVKFLGDWVNQNLGINFDNLAINLGRGAGFVFGAFADGMMQAANTLILPAVLWIATAIADFLVGESPPPKGPLSQIDTGGANVMSAWLDGFAGVGLQPVEEVAANVNAVLGDIGKMSLPQVQARLGQLDAALQPFNDQLAIVKSNFDAIAEPAKAALDSIDRQMGKALETLSTGAAGSAELVRALDTQRQKIQDNLDLQQNVVDQAQIQQALASAQQGQERTLLSIQQARLKAQQDLAGATGATAKATKDAADAAKSGSAGTGAATPEAAATGGAGAGGMNLPSVSDLISGQGAVNQMGTDLGQGFTEGLAVSMNSGTVDTFNGLNSQIGTQVARIGQANIGSRISDAFGSIATDIQVHLQDASTTITDWVDSIVNPGREGSIPYAFANFNLQTALATLNTNVSVGLATVTTTVSGFVTGLLDPTNVTAIQGGLTQLAANMPTVLQPLILAFSDNFGVIQEGIATWLDDNFNPDNLNSIPGNLALLPTRIQNALASLPDTFNNSVLIPIQDTVTNVGVAVAAFFTGTGEGTLKGILDGGVAWFIALPQRIFDALHSMGAIFFAVIVDPMIGALNEAITSLESFVNSALSALGTLVGSLAGVASAVGLGDQLAEIQASLVGGINLPRISLPTAPAAVMPGAASGGLFGVRVHRGEQVMGMGAGQQMSVFPRAVTRNLDILAQVLGQPMPLALNGAMSGGGSGGVNNTWNNEINMQQPPSSGNAAQQISMLMSARGRKSS